jgi:hypothetical protein
LVIPTVLLPLIKKQEINFLIDKEIPHSYPSFERVVIANDFEEGSNPLKSTSLFTKQL